MARGTYTLLSVGAVTALLSGGCNAVLGIDEAHSRDGTGQPLITYLEIPIETCDGPKTSLNCGACAQVCEGAYPACMADHGCRKALNEYRGCLGPQCGKPSCFDEFKAKGTLAQTLAECMAGECQGCLGTSPWVDMCDLYCACMGAACEADLQAQGTLPWKLGDAVDCKSKCLALGDLRSVHCRWTHCELRSIHQGVQHCTHAISESNCPLTRDLEEQCSTRNWNGWGCDKASDCCSENCGSDRICAP